jgi:large subunit ribosomal protein L29
MTKKAKEFKNLSTEEIKSRITELRKEIMKDNVQVFSGTSPTNPGKLRQAKKNIARLLTTLKQKEVKFV